MMFARVIVFSLSGTSIEKRFVLPRRENLSYDNRRSRQVRHTLKHERAFLYTGIDVIYSKSLKSYILET